MQIEFACKDIVFHFNKKHLEDETIPMWVLKFHGETYYVNHVHCKLPWDTKETPDNPSTKGSIKIKEALLTIDEQNCATIDTLTIFDKVRLRNQRLGITRIMWHGNRMDKILQEEKVKHSPFKKVYGACATAYTVCDLLDPHAVTLLGLKYSGEFRVLKPNEPQYRAYDDKKLWEEMQKEYDKEEYGEGYDDDD